MTSRMVGKGVCSQNGNTTIHIAPDLQEVTMFSYIAWPSSRSLVIRGVFPWIQAAVPLMPKTTITSAASLMSDPGCTMRCWSDPKKLNKWNTTQQEKKWDTLKGDNVMWVSGGGPFLRWIWNFLKLDCASELLRFDALTTQWSVESCPCYHSPWNF